MLYFAPFDINIVFQRYSLYFKTLYYKIHRSQLADFMNIKLSWNIWKFLANGFAIRGPRRNHKEVSYVPCISYGIGVDLYWLVGLHGERLPFVGERVWVVFFLNRRSKWSWFKWKVVMKSTDYEVVRGTPKQITKHLQ